MRCEIRIDSAMANPDEFTSLYTLHERQLFRFVAALLGQPADVDDVMQETAKKLWREFDSYDAERPFLPWACTVARYEVLSFRKRQQVRRKYFSEDVVDLLAAEWRQIDAADDRRAAALEACLRALPAADRALLDDRYSHEGTLQELAASTGRSPNALYKALQRIRESLFHCVTRKLSLPDPI